MEERAEVRTSKVKPKLSVKNVCLASTGSTGLKKKRAKEEETKKEGSQTSSFKSENGPFHFHTKCSLATETTGQEGDRA